MGVTLGFIHCQSLAHYYPIIIYWGPDFLCFVPYLVLISHDCPHPSWFFANRPSTDAEARDPDSYCFTKYWWNTGCLADLLWIYQLSCSGRIVLYYRGRGSFIGSFLWVWHAREGFKQQEPCPKGLSDKRSLAKTKTWTFSCCWEKVWAN